MAVTSTTIQDGDRIAIMRFTNDGDAEAAVTKVDVSALSANADGAACTSADIDRITYSITDGDVSILFDATTDVEAISLPQNHSGRLCFREFGGLTNNAGSGVTGDIQFTCASNTHYMIVLTLKKSYG